MDSPLLKEALSQAPDVVVWDDERYHCDGSTRYFFWAEGSDLDAFEAAMASDPTVGARRTIGETAARRFYRMSTSEREPDRSPVTTWCRLDVVLLAARGTHEGWTIRMRFPDREVLARYRQHHAERGLPFRLHSIRRVDETNDVLASGVTEAQYEALRAVYDAGYFAVPRGATQSEVADELGISAQSLSERIRRGTAVLVESNLVGTSRRT